MMDTTPRDWGPAEPEPESPAGESRWRAVLRPIVMVVLAVVVPMILLGATVAPHVEGCGGG